MRTIDRMGAQVGRRTVGVVVAAALLVGLQGCAAVAITLLGTGAGVGAGAGVEYTLNGVAYRTFTAKLDKIHGATLTTLRRMAIALKTDDVTEDGRLLVAEATDRVVEIKLEKLTLNATRVRVVVKQGTFFLDRATAGEILSQTGKILGTGPTVSQKND